MKKYLFFDTECSNCFGTHKMCEFGYILVDEYFNFIKMDVIPMSPGEGYQNRFDHDIYRRDPAFSYGFPEEVYKECPEFPHYYEKIKSLLTDTDTIVFGFAVNNDVKSINDSCNRYHCEKFTFRSYDVQILVDFAYKDDKEMPHHLADIYRHLLSKNEYYNVDSHLSRDDAIMTLVVLYKICKKLNTSVSNLIANLCPKCEYIELTEKEKHERASLKACNKLWGKTYRLYPDVENDSSFKGKKVAVWSSIKRDYKTTKSVCDKINNSDYVAVDSVSNSDYLVCLDDDDIELAKSSLKDPYEGTYIALNDFLNL